LSVFGVKKRPGVEAVGSVRLNQAPRVSGWGVGISRLAPAGYDLPVPPTDVWSREAAMSVPTISRARDLIASAVGALPLTYWSIDYSQPEPVEKRIPLMPWMIRPDRNKTRQYSLAWLVDDLMFNGRSYWHIVDRYTTGFPSSFEWMPSTDVSIDSITGRVTWNGREIDPTDVVEFLSPIEGLLYVGWRAISTAINLDQAAERFSTAEIPAGWLEQTENSEPLDSTELAELASNFQAARAQRTVAALNPFVKWRESTMDPTRLQLVEARRYQALELARLANVPSYLVSAETGSGMTYQNAVQARSDLIDFGCMAFIGCIEQTLSGDNVCPRNSFMRFDLNAWLRNPTVPNANATPNDAQISLNPNDSPAAPAAPGRPRQFDNQNAGTPA
jgi:hypothetical protein